MHDSKHRCTKVYFSCPEIRKNKNCTSVFRAAVTYSLGGASRRLARIVDTLIRLLLSCQGWVQLEISGGVKDRAKRAIIGEVRQAASEASSITAGVWGRSPILMPPQRI